MATMTPPAAPAVAAAHATPRRETPAPIVLHAELGAVLVRTRGA
jgi:hypothetical protein